MLSSIESSPDFDIALSSIVKLVAPDMICPIVLVVGVKRGVLVVLTQATTTVNKIIAEKKIPLAKTFIPINPVFIKIELYRIKNQTMYPNIFLYAEQQLQLFLIIYFI